jgi:hypothetical protein
MRAFKDTLIAAGYGIPALRAGDRIEFEILMNDRPGPHHGKAEARNIRLIEQDEVRKAILAQANMSFRY